MTKAAEEVRKLTLELAEEELIALQGSMHQKMIEAKEHLDFWVKAARESKDTDDTVHKDDIEHVKYWEKELETIESVCKKVLEAH